VPNVAKENAKARELKEKDLAATERVTTLVTFSNIFSDFLNLNILNSFSLMFLLQAFISLCGFRYMNFKPPVIFICRLILC